MNLVLFIVNVLCAGFFKHRKNGVHESKVKIKLLKRIKFNLRKCDH